MEHIQSISDYKVNLKELLKNPRHKLLDQIHSRLRNKEGKPYSMKIIAIKTSHLSMMDLDYFVKRCEKSDNFGKCFWGSLRVR